MTRALSAGQAGRCESATTTRCRCRCAGAFHGARRVTADEVATLGPNDPHRPGAPDLRAVQLTLPPAFVPTPARIYGAAPRTR